MLAGEMDPAFWRNDVLVQQRLLAKLEKRERAPGELIVVPHLGRAATGSGALVVTGLCRNAAPATPMNEAASARVKLQPMPAVSAMAPAITGEVVLPSPAPTDIRAKAAAANWAGTWSPEEAAQIV
jgi:hypothetical protein